ncbi:putative phospholipid-binding domain [Candidatus Pelagibacter sp. IMCC9063]|uniref:BON domain-containing protein n=1 Tax=Pelagibacter sp. (strain IMCC9063) TaxID=1002672 RepID=UPI000204673E|nr:BON domain-containing protein [Candidatus Pelagibacter sp. IMCC9063]AEA80836.1 putative phospholipid-binding domain [Candidatus Pelagibacter sp. IMCC9063]
MKKIVSILFILLTLSGCVGVSSQGVLGTGVNIFLDPRTLGTQIDDSIMQKSFLIRVSQIDKKYVLSVSSKVVDGHIYLTGTVGSVDEKILLTKIAWKTEGARSVKNNIKVKDKFSLKNSAKDLLITSQLKVALLSNKQVSMANYQINTVNQIIFIFGIAKSESEKREVINEAKTIQDVKNIDASIFLVSELSKNKK